MTAKSLEITFSIPIAAKDAGGAHRAIAAHGDGNFSIVISKPGSSSADEESRFSFDDIAAWSAAVLSGDPSAATIKNLGKMLAAANLMLMVGIGAIEPGKGELPL